MRFFSAFFLFSALFLAGAFSFASKLQSSDLQYYIHENPEFSFIFSKNFLHEKEFHFIYKKLHYYNQIYLKNFQRKLKENPSYIFASPNNQISNGITSGSPLKAIIFPTGVELMTKMAITNWADTLIAHEMAHVYQIGQVSNSVRFFLSIFKSSNVIFIPWPIFLNVNMGMSSFFLEGHATLNESLYAYGGRLYSGHTRALVLSQIKHRFNTTDHFIRNYLINTTLKTFATEQHYYHGAYFFSFLKEKYNDVQINSIFSRHAEHFIIPLSFISIKDAFQFSFKTSFENLAHQYIQRFLPLARKQKKSTEKAKFRSRICPSFNKDETSIFFLTSRLTSAPVLRILNKKTGKWKNKKKLFSKGKVFKIKNKFYVAASHRITPTKLIHGLFTEGMYFKKYKSQNLQDMYQTNWLAIDTTNNIRGFNLFLNGQFYSKTHSPALFGPTGDIYFFKQDKDQRILYKNKQPLFQFRGFYGKPVEVTTDDTVYFIAASPYGSSLFKWHREQGIHRLSRSDVIIDAISTSNQKFLVCEIEPEFYSYKFISPTPIKELPAFYNYSFQTPSNSFAVESIEDKQIEAEQTDDLFALDDDELQIEAEQIDTLQMEEEAINQIEEHSAPHVLPIDTLQMEEEAINQIEEHSAPYILPVEESPSIDNTASEDIKHSLHIEESPSIDTTPEANEQPPIHHREPQSISSISTTAYKALKNMRFRGISAGISNDPITKYKISTGMTFIDSMEYNLLQLNYEFLLKENWAIQAKYTNQVHRLNWNIAYIYKQGLQNFSGNRAYSYNHKVSQGLMYPLFLKGYWFATTGLNNSFAYHKIRGINQHFYYFSSHPFLQLNYKKRYSRNHSPYENFLIRTAIETNINLHSFSPHYEWQNHVQYSRHLGTEFYSYLFINHQLALKDNAVFFRHSKPLDVFNSNELNIYLREHLITQTNNLLQAGISLKKFIETPIYLSRYPISIDSIAPIVQFKYINYVDNDNKKKANETNQKVSFFEWTAGLGINFLFHHKIKYSFNFYYGFTHPISKIMHKKQNTFSSIQPTFGLRFYRR